MTNIAGEMYNLAWTNRENILHQIKEIRQDVETEGDETSIELLNARLNLVDTFWKAYQSAQATLLSSCSDPKQHAKINAGPLEAVQVYSQTLSLINAKLNSFGPTPAKRPKLPEAGPSRSLCPVAPPAPSFNGHNSAEGNRLGDRRREAFDLICDLVTLSLPQITDKNPLKILATEAKQILRKLQPMQVGAEHWNPLVCVLLLHKMDNQSRKKWLATSDLNGIPNLNHLCLFLENCDHLKKEDQLAAKLSVPTINEDIRNEACVFCQDVKHNVTQCRRFQDLVVEDRVKIIYQNKLCYRCMKRTHPCPCTGVECLDCKCTSHHYLLCVSGPGLNKKMRRALIKRAIHSVNETQGSLG